MLVKGVAVKTIPKFMELKYPDVYDRWLSTLDKEVGNTFARHSVYSSRWYDVDKYVRQPVLKAAEITLIEPKEMAWEMGEFSAEDALNGIYRFFLKFGGPVNMIKRTPFFLENYYKPSNLKLELLDETKKYAELIFFDFVDANDVIIHRIAGWGHYTLLASGAIKAEFKIESLGRKDCKMIIQWS
jgi:hypothetical protein